MFRKMAFILLLGFTIPASAQSWIEQRDNFLINWSQLNIQFTITSTHEAVASLGKQVNPQGEVIELGSYKSHELAAWQTGVQDFHSLIKNLVAESTLPGGTLGRMKPVETVRPYSSNTTYKTTGFVEVLFRFDLPSLAINNSQAVQAALPGGAENMSDLILRVPPGSKPKLALDLCFEDGQRLRSSEIQGAQWAKRLGGYWIKKEAYLPKSVNSLSALKVDVASISTDLCAYIKGKPEQKSQIQALYQSGQVYWVAQ